MLLHQSVYYAYNKEIYSEKGISYIVCYIYVYIFSHLLHKYVKLCSISQWN